VSAAAVVVAGALLAAVRFLADNGESLLKTAGDSQIEVRQVVVVNGRGGSRLVDGGFLQTEGSTPQLDITARNTGENPVLLTAARISVEDSARLAVCEYHTGDAVSASRKYAISLPLLPLPGQTVTNPLHQEISPGEVDRFKLLFRVPDNSEANYVYALRVALVGEDSSHEIPVGNFVIGVPESVNRGGRILPEGPQPFAVLDAEERLMSTWCARHNLDSLSRLLSHPGQRSPSMAALADLRLADWWPAFADRRPPRQAVEPLLRFPFGDGAVLAVFAAQRSGNPGLIEKTRREAAALLLASAEDSLQSRYGYAVPCAILNARYSLLFSPSPQAREVLAQAESQLGPAEAKRRSGGFD
jgi:hypothetical protein